MRYTVRGVAGQPLALGLRLAGLRTVAVDATGAAQEVAGLVRSPNTGVVLLQADYFDALPEELRSLLRRHATPVLLLVPPPVWEAPLSEAEAYILDLLQRAIGYRVRLR
jgi:vacuolar-type H+-ATPase subunit F/Vma7